MRCMFLRGKKDTRAGGDGEILWERLFPSYSLYFACTLFWFIRKTDSLAYWRNVGGGCVFWVRDVLLVDHRLKS